MKKEVLSFVVALGLFVIASIGIISCSKSDNPMEEKQEYKLKEFIPANADVESLIKIFNSKYSAFTKGIKNSSEIPLNEAIWNIEAGINYDFCEPRENINQLNYESITLEFEVFEYNGDYYVLEDDLFVVFEQLISFTDSNLNSKSNTFIVADVEFTGIIGDEVIIDMTIASGSPQLPSCEIEDDDYWYFATGLGKCSPYTGGIGQDASSRIDYILKLHRILM